MLDLILPVALFAFSMSITPGPNNVMVTASGANFGYRRTIPHLVGIGLGYPAMVAGVGFGLGGVFEAVPAVHVVLKYVGSGAILWMAWRIATASGTGPATERPGRPFTFLQAAAFQWVNPKGWVVAVGAVSAFTTVEGDLFLEVGAITLSFVSVNYACASVWTVFGVGIGRLLKHRNRLRIFNVATGLLLVAAIVPLFID
ncbi:MAG: LysE family translocator [Acidobacteriota bacterium]|nr:LysE family translocator [Acidobacteriota bacterium]